MPNKTSTRAGSKNRGAAVAAPRSDAEAFRNRIVELRMVKASELLANPRNYREHPAAQRDLLRGLLSEIGYVDALAARETAAGLELIDGHLRKDIDPDGELPVLILDIDEDEANKVLATLDPVTAMAVDNEAKLAELLENVTTDNAEVRRFLTDQEQKINTVEPNVEVDNEVANRDVPSMALDPHEHYDYLVVLATTTQEWNLLCDKLDLKPEKRRSNMGTCRAIRADKLLALLTRGDAARLEQKS